MNAYLTHLSIRTDIQDWLAPYYSINDAGHLCFTYGDDAEVYGLGFHRVPITGCWLAGTNSLLIRQTILCSSAMEGIAWLNFHPVNFDHIQLMATSSFQHLLKGKYTLVFGNDLLGHVYDLKAAATLAGLPISLSTADNVVDINFRFREYQLPVNSFSLHAFERRSKYRFNQIKTSKPSRHSSWLNQLLHHGDD